MKLPVSLLLLAALSEAVKLTTEETGSSKHTTKRELLEGNFGQRTEFLKKYVPTQPTPDIQYTTDEQRSTLQGQSSTQHIFGARLPHISKSSDLLTEQGLPFDAALSNHLYSPVSAYSVKLPTFKDKEGPKNFHSNSKVFKKQKHAEEDTHSSQDSSKQNSPQIDEIFSYLNAGFRLEPDTSTFPFGPGFSGFKTSFSGIPTLPQFPSFEAQTPFGFPLRNQIELLQSYKPRSQVQFAPSDLGIEYEKKLTQEKKDKSKKVKKPYKFEIPTRYELEQQHTIPIQVYNAHPNGAISYASFTNQAFLDGQPESHLQFKQYPKIQEVLESDLRQQQQFYVPQLYQPEGQKLSSSKTQLQYYLPQSQYYYGPGQQILLYPAPHSEKSPSTELNSTPQTQYEENYSNSNRQYIPQNTQQVAGHQSLDPQQSYTYKSSTAQPELIAQSNTLGPLIYQTMSNYQQLPENQPIRYTDQPVTQFQPIRYTDQPTTQYPIDDSSIQVFAPTPVPTTYPLSVQPLNPHTTSESEIAITPKSQLTHDQVVKPTTIQPESVRGVPRDTQQQPRTSFQEPIRVEDPEPTVQPLLSSPATMESISSYQPENFSSTTSQPEVLIGAHQSHTPFAANHSVQEQQLQLQGLHSNLDPVSASVEPTHPSKELESSHSTDIPSTDEQKLSTPQPTEPSTPDFEIEIATNVDHSQLPKDLRPVTTAHDDTQSQQIYSNQEQYILRGDKPPPQPNTIYHQAPFHRINQNIPSFHPNSSPYLRPFLGPIQPFIHSRSFPGSQEYVVPVDYQQSHVPANHHSSVEYFGNFARPIFGGFQ